MLGLSDRLFAALSLVAVLGFAAGCTEANPGFQGGDSGVVTRDTRSDKPAPTDGTPEAPPPVGDSTVDQIQPDVVPPVCSRDEDCNDARECTDDRCDKAAQKCINTLKKGRCYIGGKCYSKDDSPAGDSCSVCEPNDPLAWTPKGDGESCADDGLSCTDDACSQGKCAHEVKAGNCLIGGNCIKDGDVDPGDDCKVCASAASTTQTTFVDGKPCTPAAAAAAFCARLACRDVVEDSSTVVGGATVRSSQLNAVTKVSGSGVWAVGEFNSSTDGTQGVIARLDGTAFSTPSVSPEPLNAIHHRLAVGDGGVAYRFNGTSWSRSASLESKLGGKVRYGVWGAQSTGTTSLYLISGVNENNANEPGIWECSDTLGLFNCSAGTGTISKGARIGAVFGTLVGQSYGPSWAAAFGTYEDIYYRTFGKWSWNGPGGCFDGSNTACDNTDFHDFADLFGSSDHDVWAVGTNGLIVVYNGQSWKRLSNAISSQSSYDFDAVFSRPGDNLVTVAAHRDLTGSREVVLFNYNVKLDVWFGPINLRTFTGATRAGYVADIGGEDYGNFWLVGRKPAVAGGANSSYSAWVLYLK